MTEHSVPIDGIDAYDFHAYMGELVERREPFTITAGDGRPLARVEPIPAVPEPPPVTLDDLVLATRVVMKGDCALWIDGDLGVVLGPHIPGAVRIRIHRNGITVSARPENIARMARIP